MYDVQSIFHVVKELIIQQSLVGAPVSEKKRTKFLVFIVTSECH